MTFSGQWGLFPIASIPRRRADEVSGYDSVEENNARSTLVGQKFEDATELFLQEQYGWEFLKRQHRDEESQISVDLVFRTGRGVTAFVECKGSHEAKDNGLEKNEAVRRSAHSGGELSLHSSERASFRYFVVSSHPPRPGTRVELWLERAWSRGWIDGVLILEIADWSASVLSVKSSYWFCGPRWETP